MTKLIERWWMEGVVVGCVIALLGPIVYHAIGAGTAPPAERELWVPAAHRVSVRVPELIETQRPLVLVVIERRPYGEGADGWIIVVSRDMTGIPLPFEHSLEVGVQEPGWYEYRGFCVDIDGFNPRPSRGMGATIGWCRGTIGDASFNPRPSHGMGATVRPGNP